MKSTARFGIALVFLFVACRHSLAQPQPNLRVERAATGGESPTLVIRNDRATPVEAFVLRTSVNAPGNHRWKQQLEDSLLMGHTEVIGAAGSGRDSMLVRASGDENVEVAVQYKDGVAVGSPELLSEIRSVRSTVLELIPAARRKARQIAASSSTTDEFLRSIEDYKGQRMSGSLFPGLRPDSSIVMGDVRSSANLSLPAGVANGILWSRISSAAQSHSGPDTVSDALGRINSVLDSLEASLGATTGQR